ncbi:glutathione peroxidase [Hahella sp. HN01]|uniref:glutathione peroxidase n=1 Tax=Hahella sp. HN01 TaxID=2847262 RepID=UPI001C1EFB1A|nr:glutathione peroxidase [Hahella sp. HN01]MBU6950275.1 glutathione peroxidase [Hahella sp. HN01]
MPRFIKTALLSLLLCQSASALAACPALLDGDVKKLHSSQSINLCERFAGKPLVIVNTASYCGFTPQFKGLEAMYKRYREQGLEVIGMPSDDFNQEDSDAGKTAAVCFVNYGVTFTMTEAHPVKGPNAHPLFRNLAEQTGKPPQWNFHKYVVDKEGRVVAAFPSRTTPEDPDFIAAVESVL